jgi:hypothetical protein
MRILGGKNGWNDWMEKRSSISGTDVIIFKIFSPKKSAKNWRFWLKTKLNYAKFGS